MARAPTLGQLSNEDVRFIERTLARIPTSKSDAADGEADGLLKFGYHQNPYLRALTKVMWSGFALARGQLADGSQRFSQARRDATVSAIDQSTIKALDEAATALEQAMSPDGSIASFLHELRDKTMPRLWSRVCETAGLPPPRFHVLYGQKPTPMSADEIEAAELAEMAALRREPATTAPAPAPDTETADSAPTEAATPPHEPDVRPEPPPRRRREVEPVATLPAVAAAEAESAAAEDDDEDDRADETAAAGPALAMTVSRQGHADAAPELLMSAASEVLRELRVRHGAGSLRITITIEGQRTEQRQGGSGRHRRRRR